MQPQGGLPGEGLATLLTCEGPCPGMYHLVLLEVPSGSGAVGLVALWAQEGLHPSVVQHVGLEALLRAVALATLI